MIVCIAVEKPIYNDILKEIKNLSNEERMKYGSAGMGTDIRTGSEFWQGGYTALKKSVEQKLVFVYAHVYYRMAHSPYANDAKLNELIWKARNHRGAILRIPNWLIREKGKVLMMVICPQLGQVMWRIGKKMKQVSS